MIELDRRVLPPQPCSYLPDRAAVLEHRVLQEVAPGEWDGMLARGWRRFGPFYFRPACPSCAECVSIRIPVAGFRPSASQKRARKALGRWRLEVGPAVPSDDRVELYRRWHRAREVRRDWDPSPVDLGDYALQFAYPNPVAHELVAYDGDRPLLVGLFDRTPTAISAVYCFYDPAVAKHSPGVANVVWCVEHAASLGLGYVYLGYRVLGCPSLAYKARYRPHQLLHDRPAPTAAPSWTPGPTR
jgi:arginyl-tRNA--protein-N-Asp/Glu arginylyltransferase